MFTKLMDWLGADDTERTPQDNRTGFVALLVRAAKVDDHYAPEEQEMIRAILAKRFAPIEEAELSTLLAAGEAMEAAASDNVTLTKAVKASVPHEERMGVIEALWQVVLSDAHRDDEESAFLRLSVSLLGISDRDSGLARQRVIDGMSARPNR